MSNHPNPPPSPASRHLGDYDLVVLGADLAGCAAAIAAGQSGSRVLLIEAGIHPAPDLFNSLDLASDEASRKAMCRELGLADGDGCYSTGPSWHPCLLKTALEDRLDASSIDLLYLLKPYAWKAEGDWFSLSLSGKSGLWSVKTRQLIDATLGGTFVPAFACSVVRSPGVNKELSRVEFSHVDLSTLPLGGVEESPTGICFNWQRGGAGDGHVWVDFEIESAPSATPQHSSDTYAMGIAGTLAESLIATHPAFAKARISRVASAPLRLRPRLLDGGTAFHPCAGFRIAGPAGATTASAADELSASPLARIRLGQSLATAAVLDRTLKSGEGCLPITQIKTGVLVVGGGTTGASAALGAAEGGQPTVLVEMSPDLGGTGTTGGINSYWFGRRQGQAQRFSARMNPTEPADSYAANFAEGAMRMWNVEMKKKMLAAQCVTAGIRVWTSSALVAPITEENRVTGAWILTPTGLLKISATVTVDATGDGDLADAAGAAYTYGSEKTASTMWCTLCSIPEPGRYRSNFTSAVDVRDARDLTRMIRSLRRRIPGAYDHADYLSTRESRHIHAEAMVTLEDQLLQKKWPDVIAVCFSNHDIKGYSESRWLRVGLIPPNLESEVPYRALVPRGLDGLLVTGKAMGATADGLPAIRMQADFENLGYATGTAAALAVEDNASVRAISVSALQTRLVAAGVLEESRLGQSRDATQTVTDKDLEAWADMLAGAPALNTYQLMKMSERFEGTLPIVHLVAAGQRAVPFLRGLLSGPGQIQAAIALALLGQRHGSDILLARVKAALTDSLLPSITHRVLYAHTAPDQGNMPELANYLHALAYAKEPGIVPLLPGLVERIGATGARLREPTSGLFDYVDAICHITESLGDPDCLDALNALRELPIFRGNLFVGRHQVDWFNERKAFLEIRLATAAAACGSLDGWNLLVQYRADSRRPLVNHAEIARRTHGHRFSIPQLNPVVPTDSGVLA